MKLRTIFCTLLLSTFNPAYADTFEARFINQFAAISERIDGLDLWPGYHFNAKPLIFGNCEWADQDNTTHCHSYAFNLTPKNPHWQKLTLSQKPVYYLANDEINFNGYRIALENLSNNHKHLWTPINTPTLIVDEQAVIAQELYEPIIPIAAFFYPFNYYAISNSFEQYELHDSPQALANQKQRLTNLRYPYDEYLKTDSVALFLLEEKIIRIYLHTADLDTLKDYIAVNQHRNHFLSTGAIEYENKEVANRAAYIVYKSLYSDEKTLSKELADTFILDDALDISNDEFTNTIDGTRLNMEEDIQNLLSPAVELALDKLVPDWKKAVENNQQTPNEILTQHFNLNEKEIKSRVKNAFAQYDYNAITKKTDTLLSDYNKNKLALETAYQSISGIEFTHPIDMDIDELKYGNSIDNIWYENEYAINANKKINSDYLNKNIIYSERKYENEFSTKNLVTRKIPSASQLNIDGQIYTLIQFISKIKHAEMTHLQINNLSFNFNGAKGSLDVVNGKLVLSGEITNNEAKIQHQHESVQQAWIKSYGERHRGIS